MALTGSGSDGWCKDWDRCARSDADQAPSRQPRGARLALQLRRVLRCDDAGHGGRDEHVAGQPQQLVGARGRACALGQPRRSAGRALGASLPHDRLAGRVTDKRARLMYLGPPNNTDPDRTIMAHLWQGPHDCAACM